MNIYQCSVAALINRSVAAASYAASANPPKNNGRRETAQLQKDIVAAASHAADFVESVATQEMENYNIKNGKVSK